MYKVIIIIFLICIATVRLKLIDNTLKFRLIGSFNDIGLSTSGIEHSSTDNGIINKNARLTRTKRSPLMYLIPVNEEQENAHNKMTERSRPSRKIKRCKTALCKARNIPLPGENGDEIVNGESYGRSTHWKQIRTPKNSVLSKLLKKETDSNENDEDNDKLAEFLGKSLANENYPSSRKYREKSGKFVCYCQREDCPDCQSSNSRNELVGIPRTRDNILAREKFKKDRYRKLLRPNNYALPKVPLVRLPELYREIPYDLRRNHGNSNKMDILPIVRGIPSNVHPLTVPFRVAYDPPDTYLGISGPISQQHKQKSNNIYQQVPLEQYVIASKSKSDIPREPSISMSENNNVGLENNDFTTTMGYSKENDNNTDRDLEEGIEDDTNMKECIKLFGRKMCVLAARKNCDDLNKIKNQRDRNFIIGSSKNVESARDFDETSYTEQSSTDHAFNEDYFEITESNMVLNDSPYNLINIGENVDGHRVTTEQSLGNDYDKYYDSTIAYSNSEMPKYLASDIENDQKFNDDYNDSETPKYVTIDSTEAAVFEMASNQEKETTTVLTNTEMSNSKEYEILNPENESFNYEDSLDDFSDTTTKVGYETSTDSVLDATLTTKDESSTYGSQNESNNNNEHNLFEDFWSSTTKVGDEMILDTTLATMLDKKLSQNKNDINCEIRLDESTDTTTQSMDEKSTDTVLTSENESSTYNSQNQDIYYYNDFTSTSAEIEDKTSTDTILGETHSELDYSDIQVVTNGYFTSKGYDESDENYFTGLDPSGYDYHLPNEDSTNFLENSPTHDTNLQATSMPEIIKDQSNSAGVSPTRSYSDFAKSRTFTDSTMKNNFNIDKTITENAADLLEKKLTNCESQKHKIDDQVKESALQYGKLDPTIIITTKSESESQEITVDSFLGYTESPLNNMINNTTTSDRTTSSKIAKPLELRESEEISTIDDYAVDEAILTTTEKNSIELQTTEDMIDDEEMTTTVIKSNEQNVDPIVESPEESFSESTNSMMNGENLSKDFDTTSKPNSFNDNEFKKSEKHSDPSSKSTAGHLPFCDNTVLINSIRKVINNFTVDSGSPEDPYVSMDINNEELSPEILEIPNLRSFLSLPQIENVIVKKVKDHLLKFEEVSKNALTGVHPGNVIRNALRNILGVLPKTQPELPPMTVVEHQFKNHQWTTNLVTLAPVEPIDEEENQNSLQKIHENIKDLIFNPAIGLEAAKQNAVQNIIIQAVKHQMENTNNEVVEEDTIRDIVGSVLANALETKQNEDERNSFESSSIMEETTTIASNVFEDFYEHLEQITANLPLTINSNDIETTTDAITNLYTEGLVGSIQFSSTEMNKETNDFNSNQNLDQKQSAEYENRINPELVTTVIPATSNMIDVETFAVSSTESYPEFSMTQVSEETDSTVSQNIGQEPSNGYFNYTENNNSTTDSYTENFQEDHYTESTNVLELKKDTTNINEETTLGVSYGDQQQSSEATKKNKGKTNESEELRLPQDSFTSASNTGIGESSSTNQGRSSQGKEKCRLCKMESCTSTHEIVTKVHKRVKTTTKKYYGAHENVASEENPIVSSKHREEDHSTVESVEIREEVNQSNNDDDDASTTCENLSNENLRDSESNEDFFYKEKISKKKTNDNDQDDLSDLQNSELYYIGDNVKLPLEIKKLKDGSYALSISKSICENVLKRKCPCCVPLDGNVRSVRRSPVINGNTDRVVGTRKFTKVKSKASRKRPRRSIKINKRSIWDDSNFKNGLETLTMPVMTFAKKYNLRLNLDDTETENTIPGQLKRVNKIERDNIDIGSRKRLIKSSNEITKDKNEYEKENDMYFNNIDQAENTNTDNPIFQRMKFINKIQQNPELYRRQRAIEGISNDRTEIIKSLLNWLRTLILH